ncbi:DUF6712 family protein [Pontibacter kalidii]|uniref:DUF6712 family protein n=1 Tax=Pontibacter kalidii TaxID=2592049 RepID=UPI0022563010|nr:DUF6712 family protein [Pontibacter kalidii]
MALFKTKEEFQKIVRVNRATFSLENVLPDILLVERDQIKKLLGATLYAKLHAGYQDDTLDDKQKELLYLVQYALGNLAMVSYMDINQVLISDGGITRSDKAAYRFQIRSLKLNLLTKGYNGLESVLEFLEEHEKAENFTDWGINSAVVVTRQFFINSAREYSQEYDISDSRMTYLSLQSIIKKVEPFAVESVIGEALYEEIKAQIKEGNVSDENKLLLSKFIRPAVAHLVAAKAIAERSFKFSGDTISLNLEMLVDDTSEGAMANNDQLLLKKIEQAYTDGQTFLSKLRQYLNKNASADNYKAYFESELYTPDHVVPATFRNKPDTKVFAFI